MLRDPYTVPVTLENDEEVSPTPERVMSMTGGHVAFFDSLAVGKSFNRDADKEESAKAQHNPLKASC